jgi:trans-aconitate methyltransferase
MMDYYTVFKMFKWDAEDYHRSSSQQFKLGMELLTKLDLRGSERVLDIGCGDGKITVEIARRLPRGAVVGIDSSEEMIDFASKKYPPEEYPNISWQVIDARRLHFDCEFDVVFSNSCLHWIRDHLPVLEGIKRSLKPMGRTLLQMGGRGNVSRIGEILVEMLRESEWAPFFANFIFPFGFYGPEEYREWLEQVGLTPLRVELIPRDMVHEGRRGLAAWIRTTWLPFTQCVPDNRRDEFIHELADRYLERIPPDNAGLVHVQTFRLEVEALKKA